MIRSRDTKVDFQKGILIVLVIIGHAIDNVINGKFSEYAQESFYIAHEIIYSFHMPAFFIISGLFIDGWTRKEMKIAFKEKLLRLVLPYYLWVLIVTVIKNLTSTFQNNPIGWREAILSTIIPFEQYWFLYVLFIIEMLYYMFKKLTPQQNWGGYLFGIVSTCGAVLNPIIPDIWVVRLIFKYSFYFYLGTIISRITEHKKVKIYRLSVPIFTALLVGLVFYILPTNNEIIRYYYLYLTSISGYFSIAYMSCLISDKTTLYNGLCSIGEKSMSYFCIHPCILGIIRVLADIVMRERLLWVRTIFASGLTISICYVIFHYWNHGSIYDSLFGCLKVNSYNNKE